MCLLKILDGNINELLYKNNKIIDNKKLLNNQIRYIDDDIGFHKMINGYEKSISLHIYSPPDFIPVLLY